MLPKTFQTPRNQSLGLSYSMKMTGLPSWSSFLRQWKHGVRMGCVQTYRLEVCFNVQSISVKIRRCSAHKISPKKIEGVTYLFQPWLKKKTKKNDLSKSNSPILDIHQKTTRKGGDVLSHLLLTLPASLNLHRFFLRVFPSLKLIFENPQASRAILQPALNHRLYWQTLLQERFMIW